MGAESGATRGLVIAFSAVIVSFIGATAFAQLQSRDIGALADSLALDAMPSIEHLAAARSELRHMQALARSYRGGDDATRAVVVAELADAQKAVDGDLDAYLRLPVYPGEDALWAKIRSARREVDRELVSAGATVGAEDSASAAASFVALDRACDAAADALHEDIEFNAKTGERIGLRIRSLRTRSLVVAFALDAVSVLFTGVAAFLAIRQISANAKLMRRHNELLTDRAAELEQFAGRVAHDIRSPIAAATASLALVQRQPGITPKIEEVSARGLSSLHRAARFVEGLLEFARAGAHPVEGARAPVRAALGELVADLGPAAEDAGVELVFERPDDLVVRCEQSIFEVIVANLVRNAIKYMGAAAERRIVVRAIERADAVRVEVEDTGPGVPAHLRRSIFEPFVRGPSHGQAGVGLGLATVKRICEAHGGRVDVAPRSGGPGSVFWFELPRVV